VDDRTRPAAGMAGFVGVIGWADGPLRARCSGTECRAQGAEDGAGEPDGATLGIGVIDGVGSGVGSGPLPGG
jgi:hypothetical protein